MAVATLERLYDNPKVFQGVVKIRKGEAVHLMETATDIEKVKAVFTHFLLKVSYKMYIQDVAII